MSLLDDVSIVVTPNGYKAGTLYGVLPTATEGSELVVNGDFATDSVWTKGTGWTISGGKANVASGSDGAALSQDICQVGVVNRVVFTISNYTGSGFVRLRTGSASQVQDFSANGTYTFDVVPTSVSFSFARYVTGSLSIDNVSVKQFTASDMDVTRATAGTRVDENGLVNYAEVLGSELVTNGDFATDSDWTKGTGTTISSGVANITAGSSGGSALSQSGGIFVSGKNFKVTFTISNYSSGSIAVSNISPTTYRSANGTYTLYGIGAGGDFLLFSSGFVGSVGNISVKEVDRNNVPRIDYTGGGCPHILSEPQRTNLLTYSEDFSNSYWTKGGSSVTSGFTSPDGTTNAYKLVEDTSNSNHQVYRNTVTTTGSFSNTIFVKAAERSKIRLNSGSSSESVSFNLSNGTIISQTGATGKIVSMLNGWYKCTISWNVTSTAAQYLLLGILDDSGNASYTGNGSSGVYIWGSQFEVGTYPTSYIPTSGSTVTRNQDQFTRDGISSLINSTEGVLFIEMAAIADDLTNRVISISDGTISNRVIIFYTNVNNAFQCKVTSSGTDVMNKFFTVTDITTFNKIAVKWKLNDFAIFSNGVEVFSDSSGAIPSSLNQLKFDRGDGAEDFFGKVKQLQVYKTALTDLQIESITSWTSFTEMANALNYTIY